MQKESYGYNLYRWINFSVTKGKGDRLLLVQLAKDDLDDWVTWFGVVQSTCLLDNWNLFHLFELIDSILKAQCCQVLELYNQKEK